MTILIKFFIQLLTIASVLPSEQQVYVASTPCDNIVVRDFFDIPKEIKCEQIRWSITFQTGVPAYEARISYGMPLQNTNNLVRGGTEVVRTGTYKMEHGFKGNKNAIVYVLQRRDSKRTLRYLKVSDDLIHLIGPGDQLAIGNGGWSYTLNNLKRATTSYALSNAVTTESEAVDGVFEGRTPCSEIAAQLKKEVSADCIKLKWRIFFYKESMTYKTDGSFFRAEPRKGKFRVLHGSAGNLSAVIIQLDPDKPSESLYLLKGDDNVLFFLNDEKKCFVGNSDFSFTLNKVRKAP